MYKLILGTQTFGSDTNFKESIEILNRSIKYGIKKIDIAERYPFPESFESFGLTEKIIGSWIS